MIRNRIKHPSAFAPETLADFMADARELLAKLNTGHADLTDVARFQDRNPKAREAWSRVTKHLHRRG